ncbi:hypothetical protein U9M48_037284 [Paspalum notatum var. saurae]|uniref:Uncharacterized protein n=1 Tax=Paspalum notatum var. saurae TaxID=547442 RepID=A0AAQ3XC94_PASNO
MAEATHGCGAGGEGRCVAAEVLRVGVGGGRARWPVEGRRGQLSGAPRAEGGDGDDPRGFMAKRARGPTRPALDGQKIACTPIWPAWAHEGARVSDWGVLGAAYFEKWPRAGEAWQPIVQALLGIRDEPLRHHRSGVRAGPTLPLIPVGWGGRAPLPKITRAIVADIRRQEKLRPSPMRVEPSR